MIERLVRHSILCSFTMLLFGCEPYRVEYHKRPAFYEKASLGELPSEVTLEDGTVVRYRTQQPHTSFGRTGAEGNKPFLIREELEDGSTVLRALMPEHVISNALTCIQNEEYELLWDQLIATKTKKAYSTQDKGVDECAAFFQKHRHELAATLTRMLAGFPHMEVSMTEMPDHVTRCTLRPQIAQPFVFKTVDIIKEDGWLKLVLIH